MRETTEARKSRMARRRVRIDPAVVERLRVALYPEHQGALARAARVSTTTVSRMERMSGPYELSAVERVAEALGVAVAELLLDDDRVRAEDRGRLLLPRFARMLPRIRSQSERRHYADECRTMLQLWEHGMIGADEDERRVSEHVRRRAI